MKEESVRVNYQPDSLTARDEKMLSWNKLWIGKNKLCEHFTYMTSGLLAGVYFKYIVAVSDTDLVPELRALVKKPT